jgi:hypothetical protein
MTSHRVDLVDEDDAGRMLLAWSNMSRTREAPTPTNISTKSEPEIVKNGTFASPAIARASSVLPVPGEPTIRTPRGILPPELLELGRILEEVDDLAHFLLGLVDAGYVGESHGYLVLVQQPSAALAEGHRAAASRPALHLAHEVHPDADQQQNRKRGDEELHQEGLPLGRRGAESHAVVLQRPDQRRVVGLRIEDHELLTAGADPVDLVAGERDLRDRAVLDVLEECRIGHLLNGSGTRAEIADDRREHHRDHDPQDDILGQIVQFLRPRTPALPRGRAPIQSRSTLHQSIPTCQNVHLGAATSGRFRLAKLHCFEVRPQADHQWLKLATLKNLQQQVAAGPQGLRGEIRREVHQMHRTGVVHLRNAHCVGARSDKTRSARAPSNSPSSRSSVACSEKSPCNTSTPVSPAIGRMSTAMTRPRPARIRAAYWLQPPGAAPRSIDGHAGLQQVVAALDLLPA